jgi:hypothetical protein
MHVGPVRTFDVVGPHLDSCLLHLSRRYALQTAFAAVAVPLQTDKFYDLAGSLGAYPSTVHKLLTRLTWPLQVSSPPPCSRPTTLPSVHVSHSTMVPYYRSSTRYKRLVLASCSSPP